MRPVSRLENDDELLSNVIASQIEGYKIAGGVVSGASRHHVEVITNCIEEALAEAGISVKKMWQLGGYYGPGLAGILLCWSPAAKAFA